MSHPLNFAELDLNNQRVMIREDLNVPLKDGVITDDTRIQRALPTIRAAIKANARVMIVSHLGRPTEGKPSRELSLAPVAAALTQALGQSVALVTDWLQSIDVAPGQVVLCDNVRFQVGEKNNDPALAQRMAAHCDIFVMDAFATAHRAHASTVGIAEYAKIACAGPLLTAELSALQTALSQPKKPLLAIVGGAKVSSKIQLLDSLLDTVDYLIVGGGIANTFLAAQGHAIGQSLYEPTFVAEAQRILARAAETNTIIPLPTDVMVANKFSADATATIKTVDTIADHDMILDVGPATRATYPALMAQAGTIVWNGPVGVFEFPAFSIGTQALGKAIADSHAFSIAGGGDTLAALAQFNLTNKISYVSTGGGAFLAYLQGDPLPAVAALEKHINV